jgi:hypothetical protein
MNTESLNRWLVLGANLGVIAGIMFLAIELRQNNELLAADARFNRLQLSWNGWQSLAENGDLTDLIVATRNGEILQESAQVRVDAVLMRILITMEWLYRELPPDSPERLYMRGALQVVLSGTGIGADLRVWESRKSGFDPDFVQWVEDNLLSE